SQTFLGVIVPSLGSNNGAGLDFQVQHVASLSLVVPPPTPPQLLAPQISGTNFSFSLACDCNQDYTVWSSTNLATANWTVRSNFTGNGATKQVTLPVPDGIPQEFFKVSRP